VVLTGVVARADPQHEPSLGQHVRVDCELRQVRGVAEGLAADHRAVAQAGVTPGQPRQVDEAFQVGLLAPAHVILDPDRVEADLACPLEVGFVRLHQPARERRVVFVEPLRDRPGRRLHDPAEGKRAI
jgi:hypothetical protein